MTLHIKQALENLYNTECRIEKEICLFGIYPDKRCKILYLLDVLATLTKYYIHCSKYKDVNNSAKGLGRFIKSTINTERKVVKSSKTMHMIHYTEQHK